MKTAEIKDLLKKDLLIVELPEETYYEVFKHGIYFKDHLNADRGFIEGSYTLLGSPDEIKEEDARELVEETEIGVKLNSKKYKYRAYDSQLGYATALESFHSALEKEILWENPIKIPSSDDINWFTNQRDGDFSERYTRVFDWYNNQEKTFDKKRVKIFVKN